MKDRWDTITFDWEDISDTWDSDMNSEKMDLFVYHLNENERFEVVNVNGRVVVNVYS